MPDSGRSFFRVVDFRTETGYEDQMRQSDPDILQKAKRAVPVAERISAAQLMQQIFLEHGYDVCVQTDGREHRTLVIRYALLSRSIVRRIEKDKSFSISLAAYGFQRLTFCDCFGNSSETWVVKPLSPA